MRPRTPAAIIAFALACISPHTYMRRPERRKVVGAHRRFKVALLLLHKEARLRTARTAEHRVGHRAALRNRLGRAAHRRNVRNDVPQLLRTIHTRRLDLGKRTLQLRRRTAADHDVRALRRQPLRERQAQTLRATRDQHTLHKHLTHLAFRVPHRARTQHPHRKHRRQRTTHGHGPHRLKHPCVHPPHRCRPLRTRAASARRTRAQRPPHCSRSRAMRRAATAGVSSRIPRRRTAACPPPPCRAPRLVHVLAHSRRPTSRSASAPRSLHPCRSSQARGRYAGAAAIPCSRTANSSSIHTRSACVGQGSRCASTNCSRYVCPAHAGRRQTPRLCLYGCRPRVASAVRHTLTQTDPLARIRTAAAGRSRAGHGAAQQARKEPAKGHGHSAATAPHARSPIQRSAQGQGGSPDPFRRAPAESLHRKRRPVPHAQLPVPTCHAPGGTRGAHRRDAPCTLECRVDAPAVRTREARRNSPVRLVLTQRPRHQAQRVQTVHAPAHRRAHEPHLGAWYVGSSPRNAAHAPRLDPLYTLPLRWHTCRRLHRAGIRPRPQTTASVSATAQTALALAPAPRSSHTSRSTGPAATHALHRTTPRHAVERPDGGVHPCTSWQFGCARTRPRDTRRTYHDHRPRPQWPGWAGTGPRFERLASRSSPTTVPPKTPDSAPLASPSHEDPASRSIPSRTRPRPSSCTTTS